MSVDALRLVAGESEAGVRLDAAFAAVSGISRSQARRWIDGGHIRVNGASCRASHVVRLGDEIEATPPDPAASSLEPEPIPLCVLYEDEDLIVIDKPAGLVVHPAPGHARGTLVNALLHHCASLAGIGGVLRPGIVHRLDRGTSGVMVAAKTDRAHIGLSDQFREHSIERVYRAVVRGAPRADTGVVDQPIGRHPRDRKRMSVAGTAARDARTAWRVVERFPISRHAALEVRPATGRTHQIRVHLSSIGLPIHGDPVYGRARGSDSHLQRPALHAAVLGFAHPGSGETLRFEAPLPSDLSGLLQRLRRREGASR